MRCTVMILQKEKKKTVALYSGEELQLPEQWGEAVHEDFTRMVVGALICCHHNA